MGVALHGLCQPQEAIASLGEALRLESDHVEANHCLGVVLAENGRLEEAATLLRRALKLQPDFAAANLNLAAVLAEQEKLDEASFSAAEPWNWPAARPMRSTRMKC